MNISYPSTRSTLMLGFTAVLVMSGFGVAVANPSSKNPTRPLAVHGTIDGAKALAKNAHEGCLEVERLLSQVEKSSRQGSGKYVKQGQRSRVTIWKALRNARHLALMGEPAGHELSARCSIVETAHRRMVQVIRTTPQAQRIVTKALTKHKRSRAKFLKFVEKANQAIDNGQLEAVEREIEKRGVEYEVDAVYMSVKQFNSVLGEWPLIINRCDTALAAKRKKQYAELALSKMVDPSEVILTMQQEASRLSQEIRSSGVGTIKEDQEVGPVDALKYVVVLWGNASAAISRAYATRAAFTATGKSKASQEVRQLRAAAETSIKSIVEATRASLPTEQVRTVHPQMLEQLVMVQRRIGREAETLKTACLPALDALAAKNSVYARSVQAHQRASQEPLRWRELFASQRGQKLRAGTEQVQSLLNAELKRDQWVPGPLPTGPPGQKFVAPKRITGYPVSWVIPQTANHVVGKTVHDAKMIRLTPTAKSGLVPHHHYHYSNISLEVPSDESVADLENALLVSEQFPALSYESSNAVSSAHMHDYESVGGTVQAVHVEGVVTRFIGLPDAAHSLSLLGETPDLGKEEESTRTWCYRLDLKPVWVQHRYFALGRPNG